MTYAISVHSGSESSRGEQLITRALRYLIAQLELLDDPQARVDLEDLAFILFSHEVNQANDLNVVDLSDLS